MLKERILFIGIGQGGGNITKEFEDLGYATYYINTSFEDLKTLETDAENLFHIKNAKGCAKDRDKALKYALKSYDPICDSIYSKFPNYDIIFIVNGAGGGTSAMSYILMEIMSVKFPEKLFNVISALPHRQESLLVFNNAIKSLEELLEKFEERDNVRSIFLLDNNVKQNKEDFLEINTEFAIAFDKMFGYTGTNITGNIDGEELETLLLDKGFSVIFEFESDDFKMGIAKSITEGIFSKWNTDCNYIGAILDKRFSKEPISEVIEENFGVPLADFITYDDESGNVFMATGMSFNRSVLRSLKSETKSKLTRKQEIESNVDEDEDDIDIDISSFTNKVKKKTTQPKKDATKELLSILDKYKIKE